MNAFWALVRNDLQLKKRTIHQVSAWTKFYFGIAIIIGLGGYTWGIIQGFLTWEYYYLAFLPFLIFLPFAYSISMTSKEWRNGTMGWWLTLPYPRSFLLSAKCLASFLHFVKSMVLIVAVVIVLQLEAILIRPDLFTVQQLFRDLQFGAIDSLWEIILFSPLSILVGIVMAIVRRSHLKPALPLFWVGFMLLANVYPAKALGLTPQNAPAGYPIQGLHISMSGNGFITTLLFSLVVSALLFAFSTYILDRHVEV